jgi:hypothetical protein
VSMIRAHIASEPDVLHQLMSSLFNTLLLTSHANHWAVTRPILSLMLASEASFAGTYELFSALHRRCLHEIPIPIHPSHLPLPSHYFCHFKIFLSDYQTELLLTQTPENQEKLTEEFTKLTADIQRSVETANRDRFTQKLTLFRLNVRQFLSF